jgi:hypothetical protein
LEKENISAKPDEQLKSLDYSEHDSLVSTITVTSTDSKRSENALKPNALERRYHLLYLRAFEIQCMFEGLLDKRNCMLLNKQFEKNTSDTSDEEPIAKIPKINAKFQSHKNEESNLKVNHLCDADFEDSEAEKEMECVALKADCVDHNIIVPINKASPKTPLPPSKENSLQKLSTTVAKRQKDFSKFNRSNRKSKNCAIFYYKHIDTDNDQIKTGEEKEDDSQPTVSSSEEEEIWEYSSPNNLDDVVITKEISDVEQIENNDEKSNYGHQQQAQSRQMPSNTSNKVEVSRLIIFVNLHRS